MFAAYCLALDVIHPAKPVSKRSPKHTCHTGLIPVRLPLLPAGNEYTNFSSCCQLGWNKTASEPILGDGVRDLRCYSAMKHGPVLTGPCYIASTNPMDPTCVDVSINNVCGAGECCRGAESSSVSQWCYRALLQ